MKKLTWLAALALAAPVAAGQQAPSAETIEAGRALYARHCASCHGLDGKGAGPVAASLEDAVPDLTRLGTAEGGFDADRVRTSIDGTQAASAHGTRDMPVWGRVLARSGEKRGDGWAQTEVWTLVEYVRSLQATGK